MGFAANAFMIAVMLSAPSTEFGFLVSAGNVTQVIAASGFTGAVLANTVRVRGADRVPRVTPRSGSREADGAGCRVTR